MMELSNDESHHTHNSHDNTTPTMDASNPILREALHAIDSLSSTQLYGLIVVLSVFTCGVILVLSEQPAVPELTVQQPPLANKPSQSGPEPRWHILKWFNCLVVTVFAWSLGDFIMNASDYVNEADIMFKFLVGWSVLVSYFFGFFGVSFVHDLQDVPPVAERR